MPKITRHGGPTIAGASVVAGGWSNEGDPDVWPEPAEEGGEEPSDGNNSSASDEKPSSEPEPSATAPRKRARTTGSRSKKAPTETSSVRGTGGGPEDGTSETDADEAAE